MQQTNIHVPPEILRLASCPHVMFQGLPELPICDMSVFTFNISIESNYEYH